MHRRPFAPLADLRGRRAAARRRALARLSAFVPATLAALTLLVAACVSTTSRAPRVARVATRHSPDDAPYHWPARGALRLSVWVQPWSSIEGWTPHHVRLVDSALAAWSADGSVDFRRVSRSRDADIRIHWTESLPSRHPGVTLLTPDKRGELRLATVWVNASAAARQTATGDEVVYGIIAHEIGHALGLSHAADRARLMYPVLYRLSVSDADLGALRAITGRGAAGAIAARE